MRKAAAMFVSLCVILSKVLQERLNERKFKTLESSCNNANGKKQDAKHFRFSPIRVNIMAVTLLISYNLDVMIQFAR